MTLAPPVHFFLGTCGIGEWKKSVIIQGVYTGRGGTGRGRGRTCSSNKKQQEEDLILPDDSTSTDDEQQEMKGYCTYLISFVRS